MQKKGQVTIFLITGLVILLIIGMVYYIRYYVISTESIVRPLEVENVKTFVKGCLEETTLEGLVYLGEHGGYYSEKIPYFFKDKTKIVESEVYLDRELNKYIQYNLGYCIKDFFYFDYDVSYGNFEVLSFFGSNNVKVELNYPLEIEKAGVIYPLEDFNILVDTNLSKMYTNAIFITDDYMANSGWNCMTCIYDKLIEDNFNLYIYYSDRGILYSLVDGGNNTFDFKLW